MNKALPLSPYTYLAQSLCLLIVMLLVSCNDHKFQSHTPIKWSPTIDSFLNNKKTVEPKVDSLRQRVTHAKTDTEAINAINKLSRMYFIDQEIHPYARRIDDEVIKKSQKLDYEYGVINAMINLGTHFQSIKKVRDSLLNVSYQKAQKNGYKDLEVEALLSLAHTTIGSNPVQSISYCKEALEIARNLKNNQLVLQCLSSLSFYYSLQRKDYLALESNQIGLELAQTLDANDEIIGFIQSRGLIYQNKSDFKAALQCSQQLLRMRVHVKDTTKLIRDLLGVGYLQNKLSDTVRAWESVAKGLALSKAINDSTYIGWCLRDMANICKDKEDYSNAIAYTVASYNFLNESDGRELDTMDIYGLGEIYELQESYIKAESAYIARIKKARYENYSIVISVALKKLCSLYITMKEFKKAKEAGEEALLWLEKPDDEVITDMITQRFELYSSLSLVFDSLRLSAKAFKMYRLSIEMKDSIDSKEKTKKFAEMEFQEKEKQAIEKQQKKNLLAGIEMRRQKVIRNVSMSGAFVFILFAGAAGLAYRQKRKDNQIISLEKEKSDALLKHILPDEVAEELKQKGSSKAKMFDHVSVLFTDFINF
jgi:adenylate cyclase